MNEDLVNPINYGIPAEKIYYFREEVREKFNISIEELESIGIHDGIIQIHKNLIKPLQKAQEILKMNSYGLSIIDGYRSSELYNLAYQKRLLLSGKENADNLMNMQSQPHASGLAVDVGLFSVDTKKPVFFFDSKQDGEGAYFVDFYKHTDTPQAKEFFRIQILLFDTMFQSGFSLGKKQEVWHFELVR